MDGDIRVIYPYVNGASASSAIFRALRFVPYLFYRPSMDESLARYPYVVVRISCELCARKGAYRLARLAAKYGADITLPELLGRLTADCRMREPGLHPYQGYCRARFPDLDPPMRPPDGPGAPLRVIEGGKGEGADVRVDDQTAKRKRYG